MQNGVQLLNAVGGSSSAELMGKHLTFYTGNQLYGVSISRVVQIVGMQEITVMPDYPYYAKGVMNLRGEIIPVIDVRLRLNMPEKEYDRNTCTIVTSIGEQLVGFIVDAVDEVVEFTDEMVSPPPRVNGSDNTLVTGVAKNGEKIILLLEMSTMISTEELSLLSTGIIA